MLSGLDLLVAVVWIALLLVELVARARRSLRCHDATEVRELGSRTSLEGDGGFHLPLPPKRRAATAGDLIRLPLAPVNLMRQRTNPTGPAGKAQRAAAQPPRAAAQAATVPSKNSSSSSAVAKAQAAAADSSARPKAAVKRNKSVDACQNRAPVATAVAATAAATPALTPTGTSLAPAAARAGTAAATAGSAAVARQPSVIRGVVPPPQLLAGLPAATLPGAANPTPNPSAPRSRGDRYSGPRVPAPDGSRGPEHQRQQHLLQPVAVVKTPRSSNGGGRVGSVPSGSAVPPASAMPALSLGALPISLPARVPHTRSQGAARSTSASPAAAPASIATVCQRSSAAPCGVAASSPPAKPVSSTKVGTEKPQMQLDKELQPQQPQSQSEGCSSTSGLAEGAPEPSTPDDPEGDVWLPPPPACGSSASSPSQGVLPVLPGRLSPRQQAAELAAVAAPAASPQAAPAAAAPVLHAALLVAVIPARPAACRSGAVPSQQCSSSQDQTQEQVPQVPQAQAQDAVPQHAVPLLVRQLSICCAPVSTPSAPTSLSPAASPPPPASGGWDAEAARALASCASPRPRPSSSFATPRERRSPSSAGMCLAEPDLMPSAVSASAGANAAAVAAGATASTAQAVRQHGRLLRQVSAGAATTPVWAAQADADTAASATPPRQLTVSAFRTPPRTPPVCSPAAPRGFNMLQASPFSPSVLTPPPALPPPPPSPSRVLRPVPVSAGGSSVRPRAPATPTAGVAVCVEEAGQGAAGVPPRSPSVLARAAHFEQIARVQAAAAAAAVTAASASPAPSPCGANAAAAPHGSGQHGPRVPRGSGGGSTAASRGVAHACCSDSPGCGLQPSMSAPVLWAGPSLSTGGSLAAGPSCLRADAAVDVCFSCAGIATGGQSGLGGGSAGWVAALGGSAGGASADCSIMPSRASSFSVASTAADASHISSSSGGVCSSRTSWTGLGPASGACSLGGSSSRSLGGDIASCGNSSGGGAPAAVIHVGGNLTPTSS